jgi:hypothetical protein
MDQGEGGLKALEEKGRLRKLEQDAAAQQARLATEQSEEGAKQRLARWRTSALANKVTLSSDTVIAFFVVWFFASAASLPYFYYFATGLPIWGSNHKIPQFDVHRDGYTAFCPFVIITVTFVVVMTLRQFANKDSRLTYARECAWALSLPFHIQDYPDVLGAEKAEFRIEIHYAGTKADPARMEDALRGLDDPFESSFSVESGDADKIRMKFNGMFERRAGHAFMLAFHKIVENVLLPMHGQAPIGHLVVS